MNVIPTYLSLFCVSLCLYYGNQMYGLHRMLTRGSREFRDIL